jgi:hypothetical protein
VNKKIKYLFLFINLQEIKTKKLVKNCDIKFEKSQNSVLTLCHQKVCNEEPYRDFKNSYEKESQKDRNF